MNREIAENVYNKALRTDQNEEKTLSGNDSGENNDLFSAQQNESRKDLLYRIHLKNKYIKRLLCEHGSMIEMNAKQKEEILLLHVSLKQKNHQLEKAIAELITEKQSNRLNAENVDKLQNKIASVRKRMTKIEQEKRKYKNDIICLGEEIQKKINHWNELLAIKHLNINEKRNAEEQNVEKIEDISNVDNKQIEIDSLAKAITKRNIIISELEVLLTQLTEEISESANVINRIVNSMANREMNFAEHLDKLQKQLERIVGKSVVITNDNVIKTNVKKKYKQKSKKDKNQTN